METKICSRCKKELPLSSFSWRNKERRIIAPECKDCRNIINRNIYRQNPSRYINNKKLRIERLRQWLIHYKSDKKCTICGESHPACLEFHHIDPKEKDIAIAKIPFLGWTIERLQKEIDKCIILCSNCHKKLHWNVTHDKI